jgi:hypothetical protein
MMTKTTLAAAAIVIAAGLVHGRITDRWGVPTAVSDAAGRLEQLPDEIGGWQGTREEVSPRILAAAGAHGIIIREYRSPRGDQVRIMLVCGRPGPVTRHPPNVCFTGAGLQQVSAINAVDVPQALHQGGNRFARCQFAHEGNPARMTTWWSFSANGRDWQMPSDPRFAFAAKGWLYKLYVVAIENDDERVIAERDAFVDQVLAELARILI